jgi:integrase
MDSSGAIVEPKSRQGKRKVPIVGVLHDLFVEHRAATWKEGYVLGTAPDRPFTLSNVHRRAKLAWRKANKKREQAEQPALAPIGLHEARHTFASLLIAAGINAKAISVILGHASVETTFDLRGGSAARSTIPPAWSRQLPISSFEEWHSIASGVEAVDLDLVAADHEVRVDVGAVDAHVS